jgi:hypothetical protein
VPRLREISLFRAGCLCSDSVIDEDFSNDLNEDFTFTAMVMSSSQGLKQTVLRKNHVPPSSQAPKKEIEAFKKTKRALPLDENHSDSDYEKEYDLKERQFIIKLDVRKLQDTRNKRLKAETPDLARHGFWIYS